MLEVRKKLRGNWGRTVVSEGHCISFVEVNHLSAFKCALSSRENCVHENGLSVAFWIHTQYTYIRNHAAEVKFVCMRDISTRFISTSGQTWKIVHCFYVKMYIFCLLQWIQILRNENIEPNKDHHRGTKCIRLLVGFCVLGFFHAKKKRKNFCIYIGNIYYTV